MASLTGTGYANIGRKRFREEYAKMMKDVAPSKRR